MKAYQWVIIGSSALTFLQSINVWEVGALIIAINYIENMTRLAVFIRSEIKTLHFVLTAASCSPDMIQEPAMSLIVPDRSDGSGCAG